MRYWLPLVAALVCLVVSTKMSSPIVMYVLIIVAFALVIEVSTKAFEQAGGRGGMGDHRQ